MVYCCVEDKINTNNMGFFKKFKKLVFWRKREKSGEKGENSKEDLSPPSTCAQDGHL